MRNISRIVCAWAVALAIPLAALDSDAQAKARAELAQAGGELRKLSRVFNLIHEVAAPSVVAIHTRARATIPVRTPFGGVMLRDGGEVEVGEGSGFFIASDATVSYIVTNCHVVLRMDQEQRYERDRDGNFIPYDRLTVELNDGREIDAQYVGWSPRSDLAVLRVALPNMPVLAWADSDHVHVGDWVVALGYPLGVGYSATSGIVSATERSTGVYRQLNGLESFIQTDAAINPGNSGGPLVDLAGKIVGVNSNILSRTGVNIGLGFAIPANLARRIVDDLIAYGEEKVPAIGVVLEPVGAEQAAASGLSAAAVRLKEVFANTPAERGGLQAGDIVLAIDGVKVISDQQLAARLAACRIGQEVTLSISRSGSQLERVVIPVDRVDLEQDRRIAVKPFGLLLADDDQPGLVITDVDPRGLAAQAGLEPGNRLLSERSLGALTAATAKTLASKREVILEVLKDDRTIWLRLRR